MDRLEALREELLSKGSADVQVLGMDLSLPDAAERMRELLPADIDFLINCAGFGDYHSFAESDPARIAAMIAVNITAVTELTRIVMPGMIARGVGRILNVASTAAFRPGPGGAAYAATKAYVLSFSEALALETAGTGVTVTTLCPGPTDTEFLAAAGMTAQPRRRKLAAAAHVARIGVNAAVAGARVIVPGSTNKVVATLSRLAPAIMAALGSRRNELRTLEFCGLPLLTGRMNEIASWIAARATASLGAPVIAAHVNVFNYYLLLHQHAGAFEAVRGHYQCLFDGVGMKIGALLAGHGLLPDLNGTDLFPLVMQRIADAAAPVFFLGATPTVLTGAIAQVRRRYPRLRIAGSHDGYFTEAEWPAVAAAVHKSGASLLLVSMGSAMQTDFLVRHRGDFGVNLVWNVGGLFDFVSGAKPRAPRWIRAARLEWLYRLACEPRRMWIRTCIAAPWFCYRILRDSYFARRGRHDPAFRRAHTIC